MGLLDGDRQASDEAGALHDNRGQSRLQLPYRLGAGSQRGSEQYTFKEVRKHAVSSMVSPEVPSAEVRANLEQRMIRGPAIELRHDLPWRSKVAALRDYFDMCALVFEGERGRSYFWFLFAMQSPIAIALAPLEPRDMIISSSHILDSIVPGGSLDVFDFNFDVAWGEFTLCDELKLTGNEKVWVLPHLVCTRENLVQSHANCVKLDDFLQGLPPSTRGAVSGCGSARGSHATSKPSEDILVMFPWLRTYTETSNAAKPPQDAAASRWSTSSVTIDFDEQELDRIRLSLEEKRLEWSDARIGVGDDFVVVVTGGPWAKANLGVDYDAFRAKSRGGHPEMWCRMYGLPLSSSFTFAAYGEHNASVLAESWARKMQFWYDLFAASPLGPEFVYSDDVVATYFEVPAFEVFVAELPVRSNARVRVNQIRAFRPVQRAFGFDT